jgi:hypothetical protein
VRAPDSSRGRDAVRQLLEPWLRELAGTRISADIPVPEPRLNGFIRDRLRASDGPVETASAHLRPGGEFDIRIVLRRPRLAPPVRITVRIEEQPRFPDSPLFVLRWSLPGMGPLAAFMGSALAVFTSLPPGIVVEGDRIIVNIAQLLREHGGGDAVDCVTALRVETHDERLLVSVALQIPGAA